MSHNVFVVKYCAPAGPKKFVPPLPDQPPAEEVKKQVGEIPAGPQKPSDQNSQDPEQVGTRGVKLQPDQQKSTIVQSEAQTKKKTGNNKNKPDNNTVREHVDPPIKEKLPKAAGKPDKADSKPAHKEAKQPKQNAKQNLSLLELLKMSPADVVLTIEKNPTMVGQAVYRYQCRTVLVPELLQQQFVFDCKAFRVLLSECIDEFRQYPAELQQFSQKLSEFTCLTAEKIGRLHVQKDTVTEQVLAFMSQNKSEQFIVQKCTQACYPTLWVLESLPAPKSMK